VERPVKTSKFQTRTPKQQYYGIRVTQRCAQRQDISQL